MEEGTLSHNARGSQRSVVARSNTKSASLVSSIVVIKWCGRSAEKKNLGTFPFRDTPGSLLKPAQSLDQPAQSHDCHMCDEGGIWHAYFYFTTASLSF